MHPDQQDGQLQGGAPEKPRSSTGRGWHPIPPPLPQILPYQHSYRHALITPPKGQPGTERPALQSAQYGMDLPVLQPAAYGNHPPPPVTKRPWSPGSGGSVRGRGSSSRSSADGLPEVSLLPGGIAVPAPFLSGTRTAPASSGTQGRPRVSPEEPKALQAAAQREQLRQTLRNSPTGPDASPVPPPQGPQTTAQPQQQTYQNPFQPPFLHQHHHEQQQQQQQQPPYLHQHQQRQCPLQHLQYHQQQQHLFMHGSEVQAGPAFVPGRRHVSLVYSALKRLSICFPMLPHALMIAAVRLAARKSEAPWQPQQPVSPWQHEPRQILTLLRSIADMAGANYSMPTAELQTHIVGAIASLKEGYLAGEPCLKADPLSLVDESGLHVGVLPSYSSTTLEAALLAVCARPQLSAPAADDAARQPPPRLVAPPCGARRPIPAAAAAWLASVSRRELMTGVLQDGVPHLVAPLPAGGIVAISAEVDFGVCEVVRAHNRTSRSINPAAEDRLRSEFADDATHSDNGMSGGHSNDMGGGKPTTLYRQIRLHNESQNQLAWIIAVDVTPPMPRVLSYHDDCGLAGTSQLGETQGSSKGDRDGGGGGMGEPVENSSVIGVLLRPGDDYTVTVAANIALDDDTPAAGVVEQYVLLTLLLPTAAVAVVAPRCRCAVLGLPEWTVVMQGRRVTAAMVDSAAAVAACLSAEARPFVAAHLRALFDGRPSAATGARDPFRPLLAGARSQQELEKLESTSQHPPPLPACSRNDIAFQRLLHITFSRQLETVHKAESAGRRHVNVLARLLLIEEAAMEQDIKRYDMFNVKLHKGYVVDKARRRYYQMDLTDNPINDGQVGETKTYRGPSVDIVMEGYKQTVLVLNAPGISEGRPALLPGDAVCLRSDDEPGAEHVAVLLAADGDTLLLAPPPHFWQPQRHAAERFHVRFTFDRTFFSRMHRALAEASDHLLSLLPPAAPSGLISVIAPRVTTQQLEESMEAVSQKLYGARPLNCQQLEAVAAMLQDGDSTTTGISSGGGSGSSGLHALFGPPGTGKTVTLVEAALQVFHRRPSARLLLTAPGNYSTDLLVSHLAAAGLQPRDVLRLNDPRRATAQAKADTIPYCHMSEQLGAFVLPTAEAVAASRIVVSTCTGAGMLWDIMQQATERLCIPWDQLPKSTMHLLFSHVMIDEAGQAIEPEALIPLSFLDPSGRAMVCGDPRQLGPVVRAAGARPLARSLLERMIDEAASAQAAYAAAGLAPPYSMLLNNYRSHEALLQLPSRLFYDGRLVAAVAPESVQPPAWDLLQRAAVTRDRSGRVQGDTSSDKDEEAALDEALLPASTLFYGVRGAQAREGDAPSWFNPVEAAAVVDLVAGLLGQHAAAAGGITPDSIGVMCTYRKQVVKVRLLLRQRGLGAVKVGTVDDFQGQEARVIFISTVLSRPETLPPLHATDPIALRSHHTGAGVTEDVHAGFWRNPKRFNVAITRAQALLVIVGHPVLLLQDVNWRELLKSCAARGAFRGAGSDHMAALLYGVSDESDGEEADGSGGDEGHESEGGDDGQLFGARGGKNGNDSGGEAELRATMAQLAELALLGAGDSARIFPATLDEYMQNAADEQEFRVAL